MFTTNARLSMTILPLLLITLIIVGLLAFKLGPIFIQIQKKLDNLNTVLQENISGVRVVKAFVRRKHEERRFEVVNKEFTDVNIKTLSILSVLFPFMMILVNVGILIVLWFGGVQAIEGNLSVGEVVAFINYLSTTIVPLLTMGMFGNVVASGMASAERVCEVLDDDPEIKPPNSPVLLKSNQIKGRVEFQRVGFYYNTHCEEKVLNDINFSALPGQTVAILGATGSGKTTLVNLIPRFYDATEGHVLIDGIDVRDLSQEDLLSQISVTPQETILFSGTVRENIAYGIPRAEYFEIENAAKVAQAHDFIMELPDGYNTHIAARGVNLSGGQKQRIAIARAIILKPRILILDDSTSSVDIETENKIQAALEKYLGGQSTVFLVAQRISTVLNADKILVIDKGTIAAEGTHAELMKKSPIYKEIYDSQLGDGNNLLSDLNSSKNSLMHGGK